jgi:hypothetical protein
VPNGQSFADLPFGNARHVEIGPFSVPWGRHAERDVILAQVRGFLWDHMRKHAVGRVQVTFYNLEGDPTTHAYSIELDKNGNSVVHDQVTSIEAALLPPGKKPKRETFLYKFCAFERLDRETRKSVPEEVTQAPESFTLRLKNCKTGAVLDL